jgi:hypothetical protein
MFDVGDVCGLVPWVDNNAEVQKCDDAPGGYEVRSPVDGFERTLGEPPVGGFKSMLDEGDEEGDTEEGENTGWFFGEGGPPATPTRGSPLSAPMESPELKSSAPMESPELKSSAPMESPSEPMQPLTLDPPTTQPPVLKAHTTLTLGPVYTSPVLGSKRPASGDLWPYCAECFGEALCINHSPVSPFELVEPSVKVTPPPTVNLPLDDFLADFVPTHVLDSPQCGTPREFVCEHCEASFQGFAALAKHMIYKHADASHPLVVQQKHDLVMKATARTAQVFQCPGCTDTFSKRPPLVAHFIAKHDANAVEEDILRDATTARRKSLKLAGAPGRYKKTKSALYRKK